MFVRNSLNLYQTREGTYPFVDDYINFLIQKDNNGNGSKILSSLSSYNIYPCWYCSESELLEYHNYYIPFYNIGSGEFNGILIIKEENNVKSHVYLSKSVVSDVLAQRAEPHAEYWNGIMQYFDGGSKDEDRSVVFRSPTSPCLWFGIICGCPELVNGVPSHSSCKQNDPINWSDCDSGYCDLGNYNGNNGNDGNDSGNDGWDGTGPKPLNNIYSWIPKGSGGPGKPNDTPKTWDELCVEFNGSLDATVNAGGEIVIDESTGEIAIGDLTDLYFNQLNSIINVYNLPYSAEELIGILGEECAVGNIPEMAQCLRCHFINSLGLSEQDNIFLNNNFGNAVECLNDPNPVECAECNQAFNDFIHTYGLDSELDDETIEVIKNNINNSNINCTNQSDYDEVAMISYLEEIDAFNINQQNPYKHLTECEKALVKQYPFCALEMNINKNTARNMTIARFGVNGRNECSDAFRHALFNGLNTRSCGSNVANLFGVAHECETPASQVSEREMDLFNNAVGRNIVNSNPGIGLIDLMDNICNEIALGNLKILSDPLIGSSPLINSNGCPICL